MTSRKKPGVAFCATVAVVVLALYVLSIWPAAWLVKRDLLPLRATAVFYTPVVKLIFIEPLWNVVALGDPQVAVTIFKMRVVLEPPPDESEPELLSH